MNRLRALLRNRWFRFALVALCYTLWVIWLGSWWWLLGLGIIFDLYITKKVKWAFWKKTYAPGQPRNWALDWLDALIFALVAATFLKMFFFEAYMIPSSSMENSLMTGDYLFVSKLKYGPRVPQTPLTIPLTHNRFLGRESYSTLITNKYRRMKGWGKVERFDPVVFNFPHGDTVLAQAPAADYYELSRLYGKDFVIRDYGPLIVRPKDKKDHYVKRCVALPGDSLRIQGGKVYVNGEEEPAIAGVQYSYRVVTDGSRINEKVLDKLRISRGEISFDAKLPGYAFLPMNEATAERLAQAKNVVSVTRNLDTYPPDYPDTPTSLFPFVQSPAFAWTRDNMGPLWIPCAGATVPLTPENLQLYGRVIRDYEDNTLEVKSTGRVLINGQEADSYTFRQDYYFMMGDNRHNSLDSRYWGFVPEDHIVGNPVLVWFSTDKHKTFPANIRWRRLFKTNFQ